MGFLRRVLSLAPLSLTEAMTLIGGGLGLTVLSLAAPLAPIVAGLGFLAAARGAIGLVAGWLDAARRLRAASGWPGNRAPQTDAEVAELLARRPSGWEFYLMVGYLILGRERVEPQYLDHELRDRPPAADRVDDEDVVAFLHDALEDVQRIIANLTETMRPEVQERAYGPRGTPGDPARIKHLADRLTGFYADLLGWAARLRGTAISERYRRLLDLLTRLVDRSVENYRLFVDAYRGEVDGPMTEAIRTNGSWEGRLTLTLDIDKETLDAITAETDRLASDG
jgi:hypothetical protein